MSIKTLSSREVYRNPWMTVREDRIERSNGTEGIYGVVDKHDCAIIVPIERETVYLIEQFRYTVQQRCLELPRADGKPRTLTPRNWPVGNCARKPAWPRPR